MTPPHRFPHGGWRFTLLSGLSPDRALWEWRLLAAGFPVPMTHLTEWARVGKLRTWFLGVEDPDGNCRGGITLRANRSRLAPGFTILRVERFGGSIHPAARGATLEALSMVAAMIPRVLRVHVGLYSLDTSQVEAMGRTARASGFRPSTAPRGYDWTAIVDLGRPLDTLFASLQRSARQNVRSTTRFPVAVRPLTATQPAGPMNDLLAETFARTGGKVENPDWPAILQFSDLNPERSRIVGMYRTDLPDGEQLLAYAWGCFHGDSVEYATAASTRCVNLKVPMAYPLAWDLIQWAHQLGAPVFDFGGLSAGSRASGDPLGGISEFKRYFKGEPVMVGAEWTIEPHPRVAGFAHLLNRLRG